MATEKRRGCGYRKVGGLYLVGEGFAVSCDRLPYILDVCPTCNQGIKPSLGFTWIKGNNFFKDDCKNNFSECHPFCKICFPQQLDKVGLMWVGNRFYTPESFIKESREMGVSKRIAHIPKDLKSGDFVLLAHREAGTVTLENLTIQKVPAIFYGFTVTRIEKIITESESKDEKAMEELKKRSITPVVVSDEDKDHQGTVYDEPKEEEEKPQQRSLDEVMK